MVTKRRKTLILGILSGILCAACVLLYTHGLESQAEAERAEALARYGGEQLEVCVATRDIAAGETLEPSAVETKMWLVDLLPQGAISSSAEVVGKEVGSPIYAGEVITSKRFEAQSAALDIPAGLAAVSVPAKDVQAVGGSVSPGMKVDVYATGSTSTSLIASSALVIATSAEAEGLSGNSSSWITLAVEPEKIQELVTAAQTTELYFVIPGVGTDTVSGETAEVLPNESSASATDAAAVEETTQNETTESQASENAEQNFADALEDLNDKEA